MTTRIQLRRTNTTGNVPANMLSGELQVNQADQQLFMGDGETIPATIPLLAVRNFSATASYPIGAIVVYNGNIYRATATVTPAAFNAAQWAILAKNGQPVDAAGALTNDGSGNLSWVPVVPLTGGTLTGPLTLPGNPASALQAAPKQYVDAAQAASLPIAGGTMTGPLVLAADPTAPLQPATKEYVDAATALGPFGRNYIQNARFQIQQRGLGAFTASGVTADRWVLGFAGDTVSATIASLSDADRTAIADEAARYALAVAFTGASAAGDYTNVYQGIESVTRLSNKTVTVSFWAKAAAAVTIGVHIQQYFGTGGSPSAYVQVAAQTVALTTSWVRYTKTFTIPSTAGKTFGTNGDSATQLVFGFSSGSTNASLLGVGVQSGTVDLYGVQLEVGSIATPLEVKNYDYDLRECQRFYQVVSVSLAFYASAGSLYILSPIVFPVRMRAAPTAILAAAPSTANVGAVAFIVDAYGIGAYYQIVSAAAGAAYNLSALYTVSAEI